MERIAIFAPTEIVVPIIMIEKPPFISESKLMDAYMRLTSSERMSNGLSAWIDRFNDNYEYWNSLKYKTRPLEIPAQELWTLVKASRLNNRIGVWPRYGIHLCLTNKMQRICHELDMNFGGSWGSNSLFPVESKNQYLVSSLMEEAISSSQMEGAATTRKVAKEMLRKRMTPKDKSQQMIYNNYQTIQFIVDNKNKPLTQELLLSVHALMTEGTLENADDAGRFRSNDNVVVANGITNEVVHVPPTHLDIPEFITHLCAFFNETGGDRMFIHPIIRGIIIHFMLAYMHPFIDGNGRTARALFYWYMLKKGYWLTEYLSISRIIVRSKNTYEKTFLYTEADGNDMGYFVSYNLRVLELAFKELQQYISRKNAIKRKSSQFLRIGNINERQAEIIQTYFDAPETMLTVKDVQVKFGITPTTAKSDIIKLVNMGLLSEIYLNKIKKGYVKSENFDRLIKSDL